MQLTYRSSCISTGLIRIHALADSAPSQACQLSVPCSCSLPWLRIPVECASDNLTFVETLDIALCRLRVRRWEPAYWRWRGVPQLSC